MKTTVPYRPVLEDGFFSFGHAFEEQMNDAYGRHYTDSEYLKDYMSGLNENEKESFRSWLDRLKVRGCGIVPIEMAMLKAHENRYVAELCNGKRIEPFPYLSERAEEYDIRVSELKYKDALEVWENRHKDLGGLALETAEWGTHSHVISLKDPKAENYLPHRYLVYLDEPVKRREYCENRMAFEHKLNGKTVKFSATPDAVCRVSGTDYGIIFDLKSGLAPPMSPHRRYQRQLYGYSLGLKKYFEKSMGVLVYMQRNGWGYQISGFDFSRKVKEQTEFLMTHLAHWLPKLGKESEREYYDKNISPEIEKYWRR